VTVAISLIMTVYNRERYLRQAIESVLAQTRKDFELIVWDDGSTDGSLAIAQHYAQTDERVRAVAAEHQGRVFSLRDAHAEAIGAYVGWVDSDDLLMPTALAETSAVLDTRPEIGMVYTDYRNIDGTGQTKNYGNRCHIPYSKDRLLLDFMTFHFRLIRNSVFDLAGGIDISLPCAEDYDLCLRLSEVTLIEHLTRPLYHYRSHQKSISYAQQVEQIRYSRESIARALTRRGLAELVTIEIDSIGRFFLRPKH
jgi:glycosyltransferase involved in cell wall biosynthesis